MPGRPPKPTALKKLAGNPGRRPLNDREPQTGPLDLTPPAELPADAAEEWTAIVPFLVRAGIAQAIHRNPLIRYCRARARYREAEAHLEAEGSIVMGQVGPKKNPWVTISREMADDMHRIEIQFGMTAAALGKLEVGGEPKPANPIIDLIEGDDD